MPGGQRQQLFYGIQALVAQLRGCVWLTERRGIASSAQVWVQQSTTATCLRRALYVELSRCQLKVSDLCLKDHQLDL